MGYFDYVNNLFDYMENNKRTENWGYRGTETSLNGLTNWLQENTKLDYNDCLRVIVKYAESRIPNYKKYGHLEHAASFIAKKIQKNGKFNDFVEWFKLLQMNRITTVSVGKKLKETDDE